MEKGPWIRDIKADQEISGIYLATEPQLARTRNNRPYWRLRLKDVTGSMDAKIWQPLCDKIPAIADGAFALVSGTSSLYNNAIQLTITAFSELTAEERQNIREEDFCKTNSHKIAHMFQSLRDRCCREFTFAPWRKITLGVLDDPVIGSAFQEAPAARHMHQAWKGGLLEHTLGVFTLCGQIADNYPELDRQTLLAGALLHDIGKTREMSSGVSITYTGEGELIGHIVLGLEIIAPFIAASDLPPHLAAHLRHLILSHHGLLEYGSPVLPKTAEAIALHHADNLDAKLAQFRQLLENAPENEFTSGVNALKRNVVKFSPTPGGASIAMSEEMIQTDPGGEPPLEVYEELPIPEEDATDMELLREVWEEEAADMGRGKQIHKKARAERCSLV